MRTLSWPTAAAAAVLVLGGCTSDDGQRPAEATSPSASPTRPSDAPTPPYAATLVAKGTGEATLTNTGRKSDRYILQVVPGNRGAVAQPVVRLKPSQSAVVRYALASPGTDGPERAPQLVAHSTTSGEDTTLDLP